MKDQKEMLQEVIDKRFVRKYNSCYQVIKQKPNLNAHSNESMISIMVNEVVEM